MREKPNKRCVICRLASQRWNEMLARRLTALRQSIVRHHRRKRITPGGNSDQNETFESELVHRCREHEIQHSA